MEELALRKKKTLGRKDLSPRKAEAWMNLRIESKARNRSSSTSMRFSNESAVWIN